MPTPNGLILPFEFVDEQLKERGIKGHVDYSTGLLLVEDNEPARQFLSTNVRPKHSTPTKSGRPRRKNLV